MFDAHRNLAQSTVAVAPTDPVNGQEFQVQPGDGQLFAANMPVTLCPPDVSPTYDNAEIGYITEVDGDVLTITREQEESLPKTAVAGWRIAATITRRTVEMLENAIQAKARRTMFNVLDFGAVGDGVHDDTTAFDSAQAAAHLTGGMVFIPEGTYVLAPGRHVRATTLGAGYGAHLLLKPNSNVLDNLLKLEDQANMSISQLRLDGNRAHQSTNFDVATHYGMYVAGSSNCVTADLWIEDFHGVGHHVYDSDGIQSYRIFSSNNAYHGYEMEQARSCSYNGIRGEGNDLHAFAVTPGEIGGSGSRNNQISNFSFTGNGEYGLASNAANGDISAFLCDGNMFSNGVIKGNGKYGANLYKQEGFIFNNIEVEGNGFIGIYCYQSGRNLWNNITLHNNSQASHGAYDELLLEGASDGHASANNIFTSLRIKIDGTTKARYAINEGANGDSNTYIGVDIIGTPSSGQKTRLSPYSRYGHVDTTSDQDIAGKKIFLSGFGVGPNSVVPDSALAGVDAPFGLTSPGRIWSKYGMQLVTTGAFDAYISNGTVQNNTFSVYYDHLSMHGFPITDVGDLEMSGSDKGLILRSPNGTRWRVTIDNSGTLQRTSL